MTSALTFQSTNFDVVQKNNQVYLDAYQIGTALGYSDPRTAIRKIFHRNQDEFSSDMTETLNLSVSGNLNKTVRVFSLRGAHLIAMFSRTKVAKQFRKWVLDVLEKQTQTTALPQRQNQLNNYCTLPQYFESGWIPACYQRASTHIRCAWVHYVKIKVHQHPHKDKFCGHIILGIGGEYEGEPQHSTESGIYRGQGYYFEFRLLDELWENIRDRLHCMNAVSPH